MKKPIVHYVPTVVDVIKKGFAAWIHPVDHHSPLVSNTRICRTSVVQSVGEKGTFETLNTIYKPVEDSYYE